MRNHRKFLCLLLVLALLVGMAAFATASAEDETLVIQTYDDEYWQRYMDDFTSKTGIKVERKAFQSIDTGAISVLLSSENSPDILMVNSGPGRVIPLADAGMLLDLTEAYATRGWNDKTASYVLAALANFSDKKYEVVDYIDVFQFYYNRAAFEAAGITETPATWDEFMTDLEKLKTTGGVEPIVIGATDNFMLGHFVGNLFQSFAGFDKMTDIIYGDASWDCPEIIAAYQALADMMAKGYINADVAAINNEEGRVRHAVGAAPMAIIGNGYLDTYIDQGMCKFEDYGTFTMPSNTDDPSVPTAGLAQSWIVNKNTKKLDTVLKFLDYVYNDKPDFLVAEGSASVPSCIIPEDKLAKLSTEAQAAASALQIGAGYNPSVFTTAKVKTAYYEANQGVVAGIMTPEEAAAYIQAAKLAELAEK